MVVQVCGNPCSKLLSRKLYYFLHVKIREVIHFLCHEEYTFLRAFYTYFLPEMFTSFINK